MSCTCFGVYLYATTNLILYSNTEFSRVSTQLAVKTKV